MMANIGLVVYVCDVLLMYFSLFFGLHPGLVPESSSQVPPERAQPVVTASPDGGAVLGRRRSHQSRPYLRSRCSRLPSPHGRLQRRGGSLPHACRLLGDDRRLRRLLARRRDVRPTGCR